MAYAEVDDAPTGDKPSKAKPKSRRRKESTDVEEDETELMTSCYFVKFRFRICRQCRLS